MARLKSPSRHALVDTALKLFWSRGYRAVSMGDLVRETGVSRGSIYSDYAGKDALFHACLDRYQEKVVTPAFAPVEREDAGLAEIRQYLETLLARRDAHPGTDSGCLVLNTLAQVSAQDVEILTRLEAHGRRIHSGLHHALSNENRKYGLLDAEEVDALAQFTVISIQGLWAQSRGSQDTAPLRQYCETLLSLLSSRLTPVAG